MYMIPMLIFNQYYRQLENTVSQHIKSVIIVFINKYICKSFLIKLSSTNDVKL